ncbi:Gmad2 immunoglobulin-like domain-containing protein [Knoellia sp. Soil729]|uniref:Gmad2 immunoglobulin-like domain-containing protein n=1 Tax=Knoellia sp. Soil729 TaxID=1736394 RepID=UPI0006F95FD5|nr:Gmad2 immunoglobulin-like domain-containing protein [Knoellia sp. Soil729]KRE43385.1 hypothetical protein ASG74_00585 [Knoellia sp. Soil729]
MTTHEDQSQTERELRAALADRAREIQPSSRLEAILSEASAQEEGPSRSRWLAGVGVAAAAAVVAATVWASWPDTDPTLPGGPASASSSPTATVPTPSASSSPSTSTDSPSSPAPSSPAPSGTAPSGATSVVAQAIYRVGTNGGSTNRPGLVREFRSAAVGGSEPARVSSAVAESLRRTQLWDGVTLDGVEVTSGGITLRLSGSGDRAPDSDRARLAVASLVWTAQAAVGRGDQPVTIRPGDGGELLGRLSSAKPFTRAGTAPEALCDIWVDTPAPGATLAPSKPVVVRGQAVAFEATVEWQLRRGDASVRDGFVTASIGAPSRGTFTVDLGRLDSGTYTFRAFTSSAKDGSTLAERVVTFSVG